MKLTKKQQWMLNYVIGAKEEYVSPTEVGKQYGKIVLGVSGHHSSIASPVLLELTKMGLLERNEKGHYKSLTKN